MNKQIIIKFGDKAIGAIHGYEVLKELYLKKHPMISAGRVIFNRNSLSEVFAGDFISKRSQKLPVDIIVVDDDNSITFKNAWIEDSSACYSSTDYYILDNIVFTIEGIDI